MAKLSIEEVNALDDEKIIQIFGNVVESYPDGVKQVFAKKPFKNVDSLCAAFSDHLENLPSSEKLKILKLHPILGGKAAERNELTLESTQEQKFAKLDVLDAANKTDFNSFNERYLKQFDFPFVICARENKAAVMMEQIQIRLQNDINTELNTGINEVKKICRLRILDLVNSP